jgi:outer membrane protein TolC
MNAYLAAHALALDSQGDVLKTREFITEETVLHYNGMLKSVWDLLDEVRNQSQATVDAIGAQRDFWSAEADLQWVLQGGEPDSFVSLGGAGEVASAAAH